MADEDMNSRTGKIQELVMVRNGLGLLYVGVYVYLSRDDLWLWYGNCHKIVIQHLTWEIIWNNVGLGLCVWFSLVNFVW